MRARGEGSKKFRGLARIKIIGFCWGEEFRIPPADFQQALVDGDADQPRVEERVSLEPLAERALTMKSLGDAMQWLCPRKRGKAMIYRQGVNLPKKTGSPRVFV